MVGGEGGRREGGREGGRRYLFIVKGRWGRVGLRKSYF